MATTIHSPHPPTHTPQSHTHSQTHTYTQTPTKTHTRTHHAATLSVHTLAAQAISTCYWLLL